MKKYLFYLLMLSLITFLTFYIYFTFNKNQESLSLWLTIPFFFILSSISGYLLFQGLQNNKQFGNKLMGNFGVRMLLCVLFVIIYLKFDGSNRNLFIISFSIQYFIFFFFEILYIVFKLRPETKTFKHENK